MSKRSKNPKRSQSPDEVVGRVLDRAAGRMDRLLAEGDPAMMELVGRCGIGPDGPTPALPVEN